MKCTKDSDTIHLTEQLKRGEYACELPVCVVENQFTITVLAGKLRLNHNSFNLDGGTYTVPAGQRQQQHYDLYECNAYNLTFYVGTHFGRQNHVDVGCCQFTLAL